MNTPPENSTDLIPVDAEIISSLLQKSIRRGETSLAQFAARRLLAQRGADVWRRLLVIAFEDVGIGAPDLLIEAVSIAADPNSRKRLGGNEASAVHLADLLAAAPKDRSSDYLICAALFHPRLRSIRLALQRAPLTDCLTVVEDAEWGLPERAVAAWLGSGIPWLGERGEEGDLLALLDCYRQLGVPDGLVDAVGIAAHKTGEAITILVPLLWLAAGGGSFHVHQSPVPPLQAAAGVPLYALDLDTRLGRAAIARFALENRSVRAFLEANVRPLRWAEAVQMAAFYVDGMPVAKRLDWPASYELEVLGRQTCLSRAGVRRDAQEDLCAVISENLEHLNEIRAAELLASLKGKGWGGSHG